MVALYVDPPLPQNMLSKVLVHQDFANPEKGFLPDPGVEGWALENKPNVTIVGYGRNNPFSGSNRLRAYGIMRWVDTKSNNYFFGWKSCSEPMEPQMVPLIVLDANGYTFPPSPSNPSYCDLWPSNTMFPEANGYAISGRGDSGGPVFIGGNIPGKENLLPSIPPAPLNPEEPIVVGTLIGGDCTTKYRAPTYTKETSAWLAKMLEDKDGDGVPDPFDVCPEGNDGDDSDGDGFPDDCDPCPWDAGKEGKFGPESYGDKDGDGVCDGEDNCPNYNPIQANSNEDAERVHNGEPLGDGCEPVPVPNFFVQYETTSQCTINPAGSSLCAVRTQLKEQNGFLADFQKSAHPLGAPLASIPVSSTQIRFCWNKNLPNTIDCTKDDAILDDLALTKFSDEDMDTPFHRVTINGQPRGVSSLSLRLYESKKEREPISWDFTSDLIFWKDKGYPNSGIDVLGPRLGRLWMHADTEVGMTEELSTGIHRKKDGSPGEQLANHYLRMYPVLKSAQIGNKEAPIFQVPACWGAECVAGKILPPSVCPSCDLFNPGDVVSRPGDTRLLAFLPNVGLHFLTEGGGYMALPADTFSNEARTLIQNSPFQVRAAEPIRSQGYGTAVPSVLFLAQNGTTVLGGLTALGGQLFSTQEARQILIENRGGGRTTEDPEGEAVVPAPSLSGYRHPNALPLLELADPPPPTPPPTPGTTNASVYSTTLGKLLVLRGQDTPNTPPADLWVRSVRDARGYKQIPLNQPLGRLVSATFTPVDRKLWVLDDRQGKFGLGQTRLLRIDPVTGNVEVVATWPRLGVFQQRWLLTDRDGHLLVASSSAALRRHMLARIEVTPTVKVTTLLLREGSLGTPPIVEPSGYRFLVDGKNKKDPLFQVQRLDTLPTTNKPLHELGASL
jgi:hypothetical protein